jgi:TP901 family phage tail tape measure protein
VSVVANVAINVDSRGAVSKLRQVQTQSQQTERAVEGLSRAFGGLAAAFGAGFALTKVIADVKELDTNLRRLGTVGGNVAALDKGLGALSDRLDSVANKAELAAASYQALSAGFTETGANLRVVEAATKAAVGGLVDVTSVVEVTTKTLNAYNMSGDQAAKVTDGISKAVELGQVQWSDYTSQLGRVASIAALAGVSLDELNAFVAAATKNGATAEVAFTGLSATLSQILTPAKESQEAAAKLGIQWNLAGLNAKGLSGLMDELAAAMDKDKEAAARMVGPIEAARGAFAAASKDGSDFKNILEQIGGAAGKTDADFQKMKGSLENTLKALDTSFKNLSEALGTAFGPTVVIAVQDITKAVNGFADFMATVPQPVMNTAGELVKLIAQMLLLQKAIQAIIALRATFIGAMVGMTGATVASGTAATTSAGAFALYTNNTRALQAQAATATPVLVGLRNVLSTIAAIGVITVAVNIAISGFQNLLAANAELDKLRGRKASGGAAAMFAGSSKEEVSRQQANARKTLEHEQKTLKGLQSPGSRLAQFVNLGGVLEGLGVPSIQSAGRREMQAKARMGSAQAVLGLDANRFPSATATPVANAMDTPLGATVGDGSSSKKRKGKSDEERAAEKAAQAEQQIQERLRGLTREIELNAQISTIKGLQFQAEMDGNKELQARLQGEERIIQIMQSTAQSLDGITDQRLQQKILAKAEGEIASANQETALEMQRIEAERTKSFDAIIADLNLELALKTATTEQERERLRIEAARAKLQADLKGQGFEQPQIDQITGLQAQVAAPLTDVQKIDQHIGKLKDEITSLTSISNIAITAAAGIGSAFATSFKGLIDGSMTAKEALGSFFKSVADMFLEMAAQIIAKQITMIILQTILKALGAVAGGGGGANLTNTQATDFGFNPSAMTGSLTPGGLFAKGGAFTNSIVSSPTMFKFADGGAMRTGLMGEAGPEAIMPLKRGADGSLGVQANGLREAMDRQQGGGSGSPVFNMSFQSTNINGVEYVSRDQLESAMAETRRNATRDGAKRGMTMTLDRIQNSSSTRRKVGI